MYGGEVHKVGKEKESVSWIVYKLDFSFEFLHVRLILAVNLWNLWPWCQVWWRWVFLRVHRKLRRLERRFMSSPVWSFDWNTIISLFIDLVNGIFLPKYDLLGPIKILLDKSCFIHSNFLICHFSLCSFRTLHFLTDILKNLFIFSVNTNLFDRFSFNLQPQK